MTYAIITTCFVRAENFNYSLYFMFSAVCLRKRVIRGGGGGGSWVCSLLIIEAK